MLNTLNINLKTDIKNDRPTALAIKLMSQDKNNNQFILRFTNGGEPVSLDSTYTVEILTKFSNSGASRLTSAIVRQDYATWEFDTAYITQDERVDNFVYVRKSGSLVVSADANAFYFDVGLSEIDKDAGRVAEVYDENYQKYLDEFKDNVNFEEIAQAESDRQANEDIRQANELLREENYNQKVDTAIVEADVVSKVDSKVTELTPQINQLTAQLAETTTKTDDIRHFRKNEVTPRFQNTIKPLITFVDDDGDLKTYEDALKNIFINNQIPCVIAAIPGRIENNDVNTMSYTQMKEMQDNYGYEISSHTYSHLYTATLTDSEIDFEMRESKRLLEENGLNVSTICMPYGSYDNRVKQIAQKYYRGVRRSGARTNPYPISNLEIWSYSTEFEDLEACKAKVDEAIANNRWLVFLFHSWTFKTLPAQRDNLALLVDYIKTKTIDVVTLDEGLNRQAPVIDVGANSEFRIGQDGLVYSRQVATYKLNLDGVTNTTPISDFFTEALSICPIASNKANFPEGKAGLLLTYNFKSSESGYQWQEYYIFNSATMYKRRVSYPSGNWTTWFNPNDQSNFPYITATRGAYTGETLPNAFPLGKVINTSVSGSTAGMPETHAGLFTINTTGLITGGSTDYGYVTQEYIRFGTNSKWIRTATSATAWSAWAKVTVA